MEPSELDWDKGLPQDVLPLVAMAGGVEEMKCMREVCKTWQLGFELGVKSIALKFGHPVLPAGLKPSQRFPMLTKLDLGLSSTSPAWLENLRDFSKLDSLILGLKSSFIEQSGCLAVQLADSDMFHIQARTSPLNLKHNDQSSGRQPS